MKTNTSLFEFLQEHSVRWGDFTLKSGKKSDLYVDVRVSALHPVGSRLIAQEALYTLLPEVKAFGGVELGAVPIVGSMLAADRMARPGFIIRKSEKGHGTRSRIENCPPEGTRVAIIEDVTTTGSSLLDAMLTAREHGLRVVQAITVVDRLEGARDLFPMAGFQQPDFMFYSLVTRDDLLHAARGA